MPPKKSIVSDDDFSDDDELVSEEEDVKPGDIKTVLKGGLPTPLYTSFNLRHLRGEYSIYPSHLPHLPPVARHLPSVNPLLDLLGICMGCQLTLRYVPDGRSGA